MRFTRHKKEFALSPWVRLVEREVSDGTQENTYHSLLQNDYVAILALTEAAEVVVVEQYRPAVDCMTLELPSGLLNEGEKPAQCAVRELYEETGWHSAFAPILLGKWHPDTGRLENSLWGFYMPRVQHDASWQPEASVASRAVTAKQLKELIESSRFNHALHLAVLGVALIKRVMPPPF